MALPATLNVGQGENDGTGDRRRDAFIKIAECLSDLDGRLSLQETAQTAFGTAATRDVGTTSGTVADGGALTAEIARAKAAEATKAPLDSPVLTGSPKAPTQPAADNSTKLASTAYADRAAANAAAAIPYTPPVRQTVLSGPAASGAPSFLPGTAASLTLAFQNVSSVSPLVLTCAQGFGAAGALNAIATFTANPSIVLPASQAFVGIYYDFDASAWGTSTLVPIYQYGGTISTVSGQYTFDIQAMQGWLGNGSTAVKSNRVYVGEAVTSASAVTSALAYAYNGFYDSGWTATLPGIGNTARQHNLGLHPLARRMIAECTTADVSYNVGDQITTEAGLFTAGPNYVAPLVLATTRKAMTIVTRETAAFATNNPGGNGYAVLTAASWRWRLVAQRGW